jgi:hypothetical protein
MRNSLHKDTAAVNGVYVDGSIRCHEAFHSVIPEAGDKVELRVQVLIDGAQVAALVPGKIGRAVRDALESDGIHVLEEQVRVIAPEHDCQALIGD